MTEHPVPLSLYIHIPWCVRKCPYCDFNSHQAKQNLPEKEYIACLLQDLAQESCFIQGRKIESIFFGGGTPGVLQGETLQFLLNEIRNELELNQNCEITLETNPGTADAEKFEQFLNAGVNRLSIGVQSFHNQQLELLGRIHNSTEAIAAFKKARQAGFENINIDLMFALPQQNRQQALDDLQQAIDLNPEHISWYQLTIEPNTVFYSKPPELPNDILIEEMEFAGKALLENNGYQQYEISAYSKAGKQCRHNLNYWQFGDYIGIGAGAHGKTSLPGKKQILRRQKTRLPEDYLNPQKSFLSAETEVSNTELPLEFMMNALRLKQGVSSALFSERTFLNDAVISQQLQQLSSEGLIANQPGRLCTTQHGYHFLNQVLSNFDN